MRPSPLPAPIPQSEPSFPYPQPGGFPCRSESSTHRTTIATSRWAGPASEHLRFRNYLRGAALPTPPATKDWSSAGQPALSNIYDNDTLGDCVIAGGYHVDAVWTGNAGQLFTATDQQIIADYSAIGGYVPGDPS